MIECKKKFPIAIFQLINWKLETENLIRMSNTIKCKKCGEEIEISEAFKHQLEEQITESLKTAHTKEIADVTKKAEEKIRKSIADEMEVKMIDAENERAELKMQKQKLQKELLQKEKEKRELTEKTERIELENQKKLNEEIEKIRDESLKTVGEKHRVEMLEYEKKINDYKKMLDDANYKLSQKSQQLQGEVFELDLEKELREAFIYDDISEVGKGVQGADIIQHVKGQSGRMAGIILWETKRAKWSPTWLPKLREDGRKTEASVCVLVCENLPKDITNFQLIEGILVTSMECVLPLASLVRRSILQTAVAKDTAAHKDEKLEILYDYLQSEAFRHRFESFAEGVKEMQIDLNYERRAMERIWKKRETQIKRMSINASRMYGELQGVMGNALPEIKTFSLPSDSVDD